MFVDSVGCCIGKVLIVKFNGVFFFNDGIIMCDWVFDGEGFVVCFEWDCVYLVVDGSLKCVLFGW